MQNNTEIWVLHSTLTRSDRRETHLPSFIQVHSILLLSIRFEKFQLFLWNFFCVIFFV